MAVVSFPGSGVGRGRAPRSTEVREDLKRLIMLGALGPGEPLRELDIAARYACSQGSVREALLALQQEGLVNRLPQRGTRVSDCTEAEAEELFRLRHSIETRAMARAFQRIDDKLLAELSDLIRSMENAAADGDEYRLSEFDRQFHLRLLGAADLPALDPILQQCLVHNQRFKITKSGAVADLKRTATRHWTILEAIKAGDSAAAVEAIGLHVATIVDLGPSVFPSDKAAPEPATRIEPLPRPTDEMQAILDRLAVEDAGLPDPTQVQPAEGRALAERRNQRWQVDHPEMVSAKRVTVPADSDLGTPHHDALLLVPEAASPGALLFVHGGGFAYCSIDTHERIARVLARDTGLPVLSVSYRLAPEDGFPAGLHDTVAAWRWLRSEPEVLGLSAGPMIIAGDSAGANIALCATLHEQAAGKPAPDGCLLLYGTFAADFETDSYRQFAEGYGLTTRQMQRYWDWYAPEPEQRNDPLASPLLADDAALAALPPVFLLKAELDPLASDTDLLKNRLDRLGREDSFRVEPGVVHGFLQMTPQLSAARESAAAAAEAAKRFVEQANRTGREP